MNGRPIAVEFSVEERQSRRWAASRVPARLAIPVAVLVVATVLTNLPGRMGIAPNVQSDYCYLLVAADRLHDGLGLTAPRPVAPHQPWEWQSDWAVLTQWPPGYPVLVCGVRMLARCSTIEACRWIGVAGCSLALVGWFAWIRRSVGRGIPETLVAAAGAGSAVTVGFLTDPSTDVLLVAALPFVLMLTEAAMNADRARGRGTLLCAAGLAAGSLFWLRYASAFVPLGICAGLLLHGVTRRRIGFRGLMIYAASAAVPVVALIASFRAVSPDTSAHAQLNLGENVSFALSASTLWNAWWTFTDFSFYDYHWYSHWALAFIPVVVVGIAISRSRRWTSDTPAVLNVAVLVALLGMLIVAATLFADKYDYVSLDRYYLPVRPLYFVFFVAPLVHAFGGRWWRMAACAPLLLVCSWTFQQDWARTYRRWSAADRPATSYGQWAHCFGDEARDVYGWLRDRTTDDVAVFSNFHEYIALETGLPANPIPPDGETLRDWLRRVAAGRGIDEVRPLFVLDPDNRWRDYWQPDPEWVHREFALTPAPDAPRGKSFGVCVCSMELPGGEAS